MAEPRLATELDPEGSHRIESEVGEIRAAIPSRVWDGRSLPVPVEEIAREVYGLRVLAKPAKEIKEAVSAPPDELGGISGLLLCGIGEIWVNAWEIEQSWGEARRRFTVGHELGHYVMHQTGRRGIYCRATGEDDQLNAPVPRPIPEVEANTFSAAMLMPRDLVRDRLSGSREADIQAIQAEFDVSRKASERRIVAVRRLAGA